MQVICLIFILILPIFRFGVGVGQILYNSNEKKEKQIGRLVGQVISVSISYAVIYFAGLFKLLFSLV